MMRCPAFALLFVLCGAGSAWATMPATYASFIEVTIDGEPGGQPGAYVVKERIENGTGVTALYLGPGNYFLENPVVIDRSGSVYIHGAGRGDNTKLYAKNPGVPLFQIEAAEVVNFANLSLWATQDWTPCPWPAVEGDPPCSPKDLEKPAVLMNNTSPTTLQIQLADVYSGYLDIKGPGNVRLESTGFRTNGLMRAAVLVDHPDAEFISIGGGYMAGTERTADPALLTDYDTVTPVEPNDPNRELDFYHVWARQGRAQIYTASNGHGLGRADFRFDSESALGPHVVAHLYSEWGVPENNDYPPTIAYVPPRAAPVDVVLKANKMNSLGVGGGSFIDYNAAGTVWLLGNGSPYHAEVVAKGDAPDATIIALGNVTSPLPGSPLFDTTATQLASAHNLALFNSVPLFNDPEATLSAVPDLPPLPRVDMVPPISRPQLTEAFSESGMMDVTDYGATPNDDSDDDLPAIQAALDASCNYDAAGNPTGTGTGVMVFIPAGTYHVSGPLLFNIGTGPGECSEDPSIDDCMSDSDCAAHGAGVCWAYSRTLPCYHGHVGGWIAGEGKDQTRIVNTNGGTVFRADSLKRVMIQGLHFETAPYDPQVPSSEGAVELEYAEGGIPSRRDTSSVYFYDVRFDGGLSGASAGITTGSNSSETIFVHSEFRNSHIGFRNGSWNALNNITYASHFEDNDYAAGSIPNSVQKHGGNWGMYSTTIRNSRIRDFTIVDPGRSFYFLNLDTNSSEVVHSDHGVGHWIMFDASTIAPQDPAEKVFSVQVTGGLSFLHTSVTAPSNIVLEGDHKIGPGNAYSLALWSDIPDHASSVAVETTGHIDETRTDGDSTLFFDDNCPLVANEDQADTDGDTVGDVCDAFPTDASESLDTDGDGIGDNGDLDDDGDGVPDAEENAAPNGGDVNDDGTLDSLQPGIASLPGLLGSDYVAVEVSGGCDSIQSVTLSPESAMASEDADNAYPLGVVGFSLPCVQASTTLYFFSDRNTGASSPYRKFGPTTPGDASTNGWYELPGVVFGSLSLSGATATTVSFSLVDGQLGDATAVDGQIVDPGGLTVPTDSDGDGISYHVDNCLQAANPLQVDSNQDGYGNACDTDLDNSGVTHIADFNLLVDAFGGQIGFPGYNPDADFTGDDRVGSPDHSIFMAIGMQTEIFDQSAEPNQDGDGWTDTRDNCPLVKNADQANADGDALGDACDADDDNDGEPDATDAFPLDASETTDSDGDGVGDNADVFPFDANESADTDSDGVGDNADADDDNDGAPDSVEEAGPNGGDSNADGSPDSLQADVASLPDLAEGDYVTVVVSGGCSEFDTVQIEPESALATEDLDYSYPLGLVGFTLPCQSADVQIYFRGSIQTEAYRKFGPSTPGDASTNGWYELPGTVIEPAVIGGSSAIRVSFALSDGQLGDATAVDGQIVDPGGPAQTAAPSVPALSSLGLLLLAVVVILGTGSGLRRW